MSLLDDLLKDPLVMRGYLALKRRHAIINRLIGWMQRIPLLGRFVYTFWFSILDEGPYQTLKPRWGMMTYAFLNDGFSPTLWHTWESMTTKGITSLYVGPNPVDGVRRPPRSRAEADLWDRLWRMRREIEASIERSNIEVAAADAAHAGEPMPRDPHEGDYPRGQRDALNFVLGLWKETRNERAGDRPLATPSREGTGGR